MKVKTRMMEVVWWSVLTVITVCFCSLEGFADPLKVTYPITSQKDKRTDYLSAVLKLALDKSGTPYSLHAAETEMTHARKIASVAKGKISVIWSGANRELEKTLDPIKIPIYGGLMGYRIFIIHKDTQPQLASVRTLDELRSFSIGMGVGWDNVAILENAGFKVYTQKYEALFNMIQAKRFDLFSRGVQEAFVEVETRKAELPALTVDKYVGLHYPKAVFLYVKKVDQRLRDALTKGLDTAYEDGSFQQFFRTHPFIETALKQANMADRRWFEIENPFFNQDDLSAIQKYLDQVSIFK